MDTRVLLRSTKRIGVAKHASPTGRWRDHAPTFTYAGRRIWDTTRYIVVAPVAWSSVSELGRLILPDGDRRLIVTVHNFDPFTFTHQGTSWVGMANSPRMTCCTAAQMGQLAVPLALALRWRDAEHRPTRVGEFGSFDQGPYASRVLYTRRASRRDGYRAADLPAQVREICVDRGVVREHELRHEAEDWIIDFPVFRYA